MRYFIEFSYNGTAYHGWQNQPNAITVQQVLEEAISTFLRDKIAVVGAGRTDAGVHAKQMFAHFAHKNPFDNNDLVFRLNSLLPEDIAIKSIRQVKDDAHARFDAEERTYEYWVVKSKDPFLQLSAHTLFLPLDIEAMNQAAYILLEYTDFKCFSKSNTDVKTFDCDIKSASWEDTGDVLVFTITANRFLRNMVRAIVGTLLDIGLGKQQPETIRSVIKTKDRGNAGASVPAKGLYLTKVSYPESIFI